MNHLAPGRAVVTCLLDRSSGTGETKAEIPGFGFY